jgi:hypothetical protein
VRGNNTVEIYDSRLREIEIEYESIYEERILLKMDLKTHSQIFTKKLF